MNPDRYGCSDIVEEIRKRNWVEVKFRLENQKTYVTNGRIASELLSDLNLLKEAFQKNFIEIDDSVLENSSIHGLEVFKFCHENRSSAPIIPDKSYNFYVNPYYEAFTNAARIGDIDLMEYLKHIGVYPNFGPSMYANLKAFQWLEQNFPDRLYYTYHTDSLELAKYLHSGGHQPTYQLYKEVVETNNTKYIEWLEAIKCPGTFNVEEIPTDYEDKLRHSLSIGDLPWILKLFGDPDRIARLDLGCDLAEPALLSILPEFVNDERFWALTEVAQRILSYINRPEHAIQAHKLYKLYEICPRVLEYLNLDRWQKAEFYLNLNDEDLSFPDLDWTCVAIVDLDRWCEWQGRCSDYEIRKKLSHMLETYADKIPELKEGFENLIDPRVDDLFDLLHSLLKPSG